ncbi:MAG: cobaltochelatase subunit CobN [Methyloceanibacter sp.]
MHLLVRETRALDEAETANDLGQSQADVVFLSFSDSDLGAIAAVWAANSGEFPTLRLANLARLRHPMSVDLYVERVIGHARCVVIRLLGGLDYWRYGAEEVAHAARAAGISLALLPGDGRDDARLAKLSTVTDATLARLDRHFASGGPENMRRALDLMAHLAGLAPDHGLAPAPVAMHGAHALGVTEIPGRPLAVIVFYRAYLLAADLAPIEELARALDWEGLNVRALYVGSLKDRDTSAFVAAKLREWRPQILLNATAFSASLDDAASPLEAAGVPVLQLVLAGSDREAWQSSSRGLSQSDFAMQVVLPELDGRLLTTAISFKTEQSAVAGLEFARVAHQPAEDGIAAAARSASLWARLATTPRAERKLALVLSDYPGAAGQAAHAVGLDAIASTVEILQLLKREGFDVGETLPANEGLVAELCDAEPAPFLSVGDYERLLAALDPDASARIMAAWGAPEEDPAIRNGHFTLRFAAHGKLMAAIQPDRGNALDRKASYHDPDLPPRHAYAAFYLWLREVACTHALIHLGTHGTLEWLPGKAMALSRSCLPAALLGGLPMIYPFIVNNPGEAAAAKRRLGAVTIGHLTPPLKPAGHSDDSLELERLIDEFAAADGLDRRRTALLRQEILDRAAAAGLLAESGADRTLTEDDQLARLDTYLCDVKDLQIRDGLHVFGRAPDADRRDEFLAALARSNPNVPAETLAVRFDAVAKCERDALITALDAKFVPPGPSGAPTRGRADVLPTGRNLYAIDPRAVPTRSALVLAEKAAEELLRRHLQDQGEWPRALVMDVWGSATMRTGGEDLAMALLLMGARPLWDQGSARVTGIEILAVAELDHPRVDVTLRISGLFRDAFETQIALFDEAVRAIAARDEPDNWNPLAASVRGLEGEAWRRGTARIYGAAPGDYGAGVATRVERGAWEARDDLGLDYLAASATAYGKGIDGLAHADGFTARVKGADAFLHQQDHAEIDLLDSLDYAAYEGGFAAAADRLGNAPALYHSDISRPEAPRVRTLVEEIARIVRGRAANPVWIEGMMRHGYRGAAEVTRSVEGLFAFAATLPARLDPQFDVLFDATLGNERVDGFLCKENPSARDAMAARFDEAIRRDLWRPRRNSVSRMHDDAS